jgi:hypothetical protein
MVRSTVWVALKSLGTRRELLVKVSKESSGRPESVEQNLRQARLGRLFLFPAGSHARECRDAIALLQAAYDSVDAVFLQHQLLDLP